MRNWPTDLLRLLLILTIGIGVQPLQAQERANENYAATNIILVKKSITGALLLVGDSDEWDQDNDKETPHWRFFVLSDAPVSSDPERFEEAKNALLLKLYSQLSLEELSKPSPISRVNQTRKRVPSLAYGYYFPEGRVTEKPRSDLFANHLNQELRAAFGDHLYSKIYSSYVDLKRIDSSVKSVIAQYGLDSRYFDSPSKVKLNDGLRATITLNQPLTLYNGDSLSSGGDFNRALDMVNSNNQKNTSSQLTGTNEEQQSKESVFMKLAQSLRSPYAIAMISLLVGIFGLIQILQVLSKRK